MHKPIEMLELGNQICNPLKKAGIYTVGQLLPYTLDDLLMIRNLGGRAIKIEDAVNKLGMHLGISEEEALELGISEERENHLHNKEEIAKIEEEISAVSGEIESVVKLNYEKSLILQELQNLIREKQTLEAQGELLNEEIYETNDLISKSSKHR